jgi:hypothetical protein
MNDGEEVQPEILEEVRDAYDIEVPNNQMPIDQVFAVEGMVISGARRIRFAVQSSVETWSLWCCRLFKRLIPVIVLAYLTLQVYETSFKTEVL